MSWPVIGWHVTGAPDMLVQCMSEHHTHGLLLHETEIPWALGFCYLALHLDLARS